MSTHIFEPQEFFDEDDVRHLLASPNIGTSRRIREIALERGVLLSKNSCDSSLISDVARIPFDWKRLDGLRRFLDVEEKFQQPRTIKLKVSDEDFDLAEVVKEFRERVKDRSQEVKFSATSENHSVLTTTYVDHRPGLLKGLQRVLIPAELEIRRNGTTVELLHGKSEEAENYVSIFTSSLKKILGSEGKIEKEEVSLFGISSPELRSKFFTELISDSKSFEFISVPKVGLNQFSGETLNDDDEGDEDQNAEDEKEEIAEKERSATARIQSATLKGDNVLVTQLYKDLAQDGYYLSSIQWECVEKTGDKRKAFFEAYFLNPDAGTGFCIEVKSCYEQTKDGDFRLIDPKARRFASKILKDKVYKRAFTISSEIQKENSKK